MRLLRFLPFALLATACAVGAGPPESSPAGGTLPITTLPAVTASPTTTTTTSAAAATATTTTTTTLVPTTDLVLDLVTTIRGDISPKSIVATGAGLFFAQNMMYRHTITVYDSSYELVATIPDTVDLRSFGYEKPAGNYRGAPVEAVPTANGAEVYVSNYQMYGPGFNRPGADDCGPTGWDESFVYRVSTSTLQIDQVIQVGAVPKFLALTPDDRLLLVSNWCSFDLSIVDTERGVEIATVPLGRHPRGIAVRGDGSHAYVAVMGSWDIAVVSLDDFSIEWFRNVGANPRHLVLDPSGRYLYATLNGAGKVVKIDTATGEVVQSMASGAAPRSMAISDDGRSLYVVNYNSNTVTKVDAATLEVLQTLPVPLRPIGIAFDDARREVWVASYSGAISVFAETAAHDAQSMETSGRGS